MEKCFPSRSGVAFLLLASALAMRRAGAELCGSQAAHVSSYFVGSPCSTTNAGRDLLTDALWGQPDNTSTAPGNSSRGTTATAAAAASPGKHHATHKALKPVSKQDVAVFVLAGFTLFIAAGAGMGGGPVLMPIYLTLGAFSQQAAVALSNSTILAGSIANVLCNGRRRHPFKDKPLVDWDLILLMQPPTLLGAVAGSYINKLLPSWISHLLLALLLTLMTVRVLQRAAIVYRRESAPHTPTHTAAQQQPIAPAGAAAAPVPAGVVSCPLPAAAATAASPPGGGTAQAPASPVSPQQPAAACAAAAASPDTPASKLQTKQSAGLPGSVGSSFIKACTSPLSGSSSSSGSIAGSSRAASNRGGSSSLGGDAVVQLELVTLQVPPAVPAAAPAADAASAGSSCSNRRSASGDGSDTLAYAPPGHHRKSSWELQDDDWDADWEAWAGDSSSTHASVQQQCAGSSMKRAQVHVQVLDPAPSVEAGAGFAGAGDMRGASSSGGGSADMRALLPPSGNSSSAPPKQQTSARAFKRRRQQQPPELAGQSTDVQVLLRSESQQLPLVPVLLIAALFVAVLLTSLFSKLAGCGTLGFWLVQWAVAPALAVIFSVGRRCVLRKVALKRAAQYDFHGDIRWTRKNSVLFPAICSLSGIIAGLFGLGGAAVLTPLMLELGVQPQVTAATSQTMLLLTSAASSITYAQMGDIPWPYAAVLMPIAFAATLLGQLALDALIKRLGRGGLVVMVLAGFFLIACGLTYYAAVDSVRHAAAMGLAAATQPGQICG